jgi:ABC-2 type transport system permease protein
MRIVAFLEKTFLENLREWKILILTLAFAPFFVYLMYGYFGAAAPAYNLLVDNRDVVDAGSNAAQGGARGLLRAWREARHPDGKPVFDVAEVRDLGVARARVRNRDADLLVEIPAGFSRRLAEFRRLAGGTPARLVNTADEKNVRGSMAMALSDYVAYTYAAKVTAAALPLEVAVLPLGTARPLRDFDLYVPALLVLAIILVLFTAAASLIKEVDQGTMTRIMLSRLGTWELLAAVSINQVLIGAVALALAYGAALTCGYRSEGSLPLLLAVGVLTTLSVVAISVLTAAFLTSIFELLTVGVFPFFVLMFFSDCMFPLPKIRMLEIAGNTLYVNDVLPTSLCVRAFNKILNFGAGPAGVSFELGAILVLTAGYFALGTWLFRRRHMGI